MVLGQVIPDVARDDGQTGLEAQIVVDDNVGFVRIRLDIFFEGWQHVVLIAVEDILNGVIALYLIAFDPPDDLQVFLGMKEDLQVEEFADLFVMQNKQAFYDDDRCRVDLKDALARIPVIEGVFRAVDRLPLDQAFDIVDEGFFIDRAGKIKILDAVAVLFLLMNGTVILIHGKHAEVFFREICFDLPEEGSFPGTAATANTNNEWIHRMVRSEFDYKSKEF